MRTAAGLVLVIGAMAAGLDAQDKLPPPAQRTFASPTTFVPDLNERVTTSELRDVVPRYTADRAPLYQISYLMGALQLWSIYKDVVVDRKLMTTKQFNDRVVRTGSMPIEMVRALVANQPLTRDYRAQWKFYGEVPEAK